MAKVQDIIIYKGEDIELDFTMSPVEDITDWTVAFTLKKSYTSNSAICSIDGSLVDPTNGTFKVIIDRDNTSIQPGSYVYDVVRTNTDDYSVLSIGTFTVKPGVRTS
jgi:hypothetical protein